MTTFTPKNKLRITRADALALTVSAAFFMELLDTTIIVPAIPQMAASFGTTPIALSSGISAYLIAVAVFIPASAWLSERYGARNVFAVAIIVFVIASILCGMSRTLSEFTTARILQGVGGAMMSPVGRLDILRRTEKSNLLRAIAFLTWPGLAAFAVGPPLGGFLATYATWNWIFFINAPIGLIGIILVFTLFDKKADDQQPPPFDLWGFLLAGSALSSLLYAFEQLNRTGGWILSIIFLSAGIALGLVAITRARTHPSPLLPLTPLSIPTFVATNLTGGGLFRAQVGAIGFILPVMCQVGLGYNAFKSGLLVLVLLAGDISAKCCANQIIRRFGFKNVLLISGALTAVSLVGLLLTTADTAVGVLASILFACGAIRSVHFSAINALMFADVPPHDMSSASTLSSMIQQISTAGGVSSAAVAIGFSAFARSKNDATLLDFTFAIGVSVVMGLCSIAFYTLLSPRTGLNVSDRGGSGRA